MTTSFPPTLVITIMVLAVGLVLLLGVFGSRLPAKVRRVIELVVSLGYPAAVGVLFAVMGYGHYREGTTNSAIGFGVGAVLMFLLAARAYGRWKKQA